MITTSEIPTYMRPSRRVFPPKFSQKGQEDSLQKYNIISGFPGGAVVENLPANAGNTGSSPGLGRSHMPRSN